MRARYAYADVRRKKCDYIYIEKRMRERRMCAENGRILHKKSLAIPMTHSSESMILPGRIHDANIKMVFHSLSLSKPGKNGFFSSKMCALVQTYSVCAYIFNKHTNTRTLIHK